MLTREGIRMTLGNDQGVSRVQVNAYENAGGAGTWASPELFGLGGSAHPDPTEGVLVTNAADSTDAARLTLSAEILRFGGGKWTREVLTGLALGDGADLEVDSAGDISRVVRAWVDSTDNLSSRVNTDDITIKIGSTTVGTILAERTTTQCLWFPVATDETLIITSLSYQVPYNSREIALFKRKLKNSDTPHDELIANPFNSSSISPGNAVDLAIKVEGGYEVWGALMASAGSTSEPANIQIGGWIV